MFNEEKFRSEGDQIYAIKADADRLLCFFYVGSKIIITNGYEKKSNKMPLSEKTKAIKYKIDYIDRCNEGSYYE